MYLLSFNLFVHLIFNLLFFRHNSLKISKFLIIIYIPIFLQKTYEIRKYNNDRINLLSSAMYSSILLNLLELSRLLLFIKISISFILPIIHFPKIFNFLLTNLVYIIIQGFFHFNYFLFIYLNI